MKIVEKDAPTENMYPKGIPVGTVVSLDAGYYIIARTSFDTAQLIDLEIGSSWDDTGMPTYGQVVKYEDLIAAVDEFPFSIIPDDAVELHVECAG